MVHSRPLVAVTTLWAGRLLQFHCPKLSAWVHPAFAIWPGAWVTVHCVFRLVPRSRLRFHCPKLKYAWVSPALNTETCIPTGAGAAAVHNVLRIVAGCAHAVKC